MKSQNNPGTPKTERAKKNILEEFPSVKEAIKQGLSVKIRF